MCREQEPGDDRGLESLAPLPPPRSLKGSASLRADRDIGIAEVPLLAKYCTPPPLPSVNFHL